MSAFADKMRANRRLVILRLLCEADGYDLNSHIIKSALADFGHQPSMDVLHADLFWLAETDLVVNRLVGETQVAQLTERGKDVAEGRAQVPGVERPGPGM